MVLWEKANTALEVLDSGRAGYRQRVALKIARIRFSMHYALCQGLLFILV